MKAIVTKRSLPKRLLSFAVGSSLGEGAQVTDIPIPEITEDEVLVKVCAIALNPIDFKDIDFISPRNSVVGCDYAGQVAEVGKNLGQRWKVGDRIAGFVHGSLCHMGSTAEPSRGRNFNFNKIHIVLPQLQILPPSFLYPATAATVVQPVRSPLSCWELP